VHSTGFGVVRQWTAAGRRHQLPDRFDFQVVRNLRRVGCLAAGALSLDDPITGYISEFSASGSGGSPMRPADDRTAVKMSGGLTEDNSWVDPFIDAGESEMLDKSGTDCAAATCQDGGIGFGGHLLLRPRIAVAAADNLISGSDAGDFPDMSTEWPPHLQAPVRRRIGSLHNPGPVGTLTTLPCMTTGVAMSLL